MPAFSCLLNTGSPSQPRWWCCCSQWHPGPTPFDGQVQRVVSSVHNASTYPVSLCRLYVLRLHVFRDITPACVCCRTDTSNRITLDNGINFAFCKLFLLQSVSQGHIYPARPSCSAVVPALLPSNHIKPSSKWIQYTWQLILWYNGNCRMSTLL